MIVIHQPSFEEILVVARDLRPEDAKELSITRNLDQPARLAASAWTAKYRRMAYIDDAPVFAFGMTLMSAQQGQVWGFGTSQASPLLALAGGTALGALVEVLESIEGPLVFPLHPRTESALSRRGLLERAERAALVTPPLGYLDFTALLASARVCLTDSGGVQKEAYLQSVPCLTLRDTSEWVETIELGWNRLIALDATAVAAALADLRRPDVHPPLYGDGHASQRIAELVAAFMR
jgi:hypothetical protein